MLVLLVMFILLIPIQYHKVPMDLPSGRPTSDAPRPVVRLSIAADGTLGWNGATVSAASLPARFGAMVADPAGPVLHIDADGEARYDVFDRTLAAAKQAGITRLGMVDNGRFARAID